MDEKWISLGYGVRRPANVEDPFLATLRAWAAVLPASGAFTGLTAARAHGLWMPPQPPQLPLFVAMAKGAGEARPLRPQLLVSRHPTPPDRMMVGGAPVAAVPDALLAAARILGVLDMVVLIDSALHLGLCNTADLLEAAAPRRRGGPQLRLATGLADCRSESAWETLLRILHRALGVAVTPQVELRDAGGQFVARADLLLDGTRSVHEYDGGHHRERESHRNDLRRERRLIAAGYARRGYSAPDLLRSAHGVLKDCDDALGREHDPSRVLGWYSWLNGSFFTQQGSRAVLERLGVDRTPSGGN